MAEEKLLPKVIGESEWFYNDKICFLSVQFCVVNTMLPLGCIMTLVFFATDNNVFGYIFLVRDTCSRDSPPDHSRIHLLDKVPHRYI